MVDVSTLFRALNVSAEGAIDQTGKTPLDDALESMTLESIEVRKELSAALQDRIQVLAQTSDRHLKFARQIVRRAELRSQGLARAVRRLLSSAPTNIDTERRLWVSLILMDLGFPRSIADLEEDQELRTAHIGDWLTLVAANGDYPAVRRAFVEAAGRGLISLAQLCLKAEVIRQHFGEKLRDFFEAISAAYVMAQDREAIAVAAKKMYGLNVSSATAVAGGNAKWWSARTERVVESARELVPA